MVGKPGVRVLKKKAIRKSTATELEQLCIELLVLDKAIYDRLILARGWLPVEIEQHGADLVKRAAIKVVIGSIVGTSPN